MIISLLLIIFSLTVLVISIYAFTHKIPDWTLPWIGFLTIIPFVILYIIGSSAQNSMSAFSGFLFLAVSIPIISYILAKNSQNWFLFSLPLFVLWGFFMCGETHPIVVLFVQTLIMLFCIIASFLLISQDFKFKLYLPLLITGIFLYTGIYIYLISYAPFDPASSLGLTCKNNYIGIIPTLTGYFIPGAVIIIGPVIAYLQKRFNKKPA